MLYVSKKGQSADASTQTAFAVHKDNRKDPRAVLAGSSVPAQVSSTP